MELSVLQKSIAESKASKVIVHSGPGSGKTATLVERIRYLLRSGADPRKIVAITFTNAAAAEITERLNRPNGLYIGTVHALANFYLMSHGCDTSDIIDEENFNELFIKIKQHPEYINEVEYLLLDEGQDSTPEQLEFIFDMIQPKNWMVFADIKQSIYRFAGATPDYILELMEKPGVKTIELNENYRSGSNIIDFGKRLIAKTKLYEYYDDSIPMRDFGGTVVYEDYLPSIVIKYLSAEDKYNDWFILTRTNQQVKEITDLLVKAHIPCDTFRSAQLTLSELRQKLEENTVKVLTIHSAKGLEANNVMVIGPNMFNIEEICVSYVAATRARNLLIWLPMSFKRKKERKTVSWE